MIMMMTGFKNFFMTEMQLDGQTPPTTIKGNLNIKPQEKQLLQVYLDNGQISQDDLDDLGKMLAGGWLFQDALSVIRQQANHRRQFQINQQPSSSGN